MSAQKIILIMLFSSIFSFSQSWVVFQPGGSGLLDNNIYEILVDSDDAKWICTYNKGLIKRENTTWTYFNPWNSGLPDTSIMCIELDSDNNIWVGTYWEGVAKYDGANWTYITPSNSGIPDAVIFDIVHDDMGNIWFATMQHGVAKFDGTNWTIFNEENSPLPDDIVLTIAIDQNNVKWFGTNHGLASFNDSSWVVHNVLAYGSDWDKVYSIEVDEDNNKWVGLWGGLLRINAGFGFQFYDTSNSGLPHHSVRDLKFDDLGVLWLATWGGLASFDGDNWTVYDTSNSSIPGEWLTSIEIDHLGRKWMGIFEVGMAVLDENIVPVEFSGFSAQVAGTSVILDWQTATETNNKGFEVERKSGNSWDKIGLVEGHGTVTDPCEYTFIDNKPELGNNLYRLKQVDFNGDYKYSEVVNVVFGEVEYSLNQNYPNPFNPTTTISFTLGEECNIKIKIYDTNGQLIKKLTEQVYSKGRHEIKFNGENLASGIYLYRIEALNSENIPVFFDMGKMVLIK